MRKEQTHMNRMWWMASAVVLLFVALAVVPVAAVTWPSNNDTFIIPANGIRTHGDNLGNDHDFSYNGNGSYYFWMVNGTQGMNAIHITTSPSSPYGQATVTDATEGTFYVSSTGGHTGDDAVLLLISVYSPTQSDVDDFQVHLDASGYNWDPQTGAAAPAWTNITHYNSTYFNSSTLDATFNVSNYLETSGSDVLQTWKFAPLDNYATYENQVMGDENFKLILVDLNVGTISTTFGHTSDLDNGGFAKIHYNITSNPSTDAKIAFNAYVYNWDAPQAKKTIHWLNRVNAYGQSAPGTSGYLVQPS